MKDKEIIEEIAKEIFNTCAWRFGKPNDYKEIFNDIAEDLTKLNYRKIPEDSVVLSKEEIEEEIDCAKCVMMIRYDSDGTKCVSYDAYKEYTDRLGDNIKKLMAKIKLLEEEHNKASKETAEKIILFIKNYTTKMFHEYHKQKDIAESDYKKCKEEMFKAYLNNDWHRCDAIMYILESISTEIDELAKQFGVEIKE